MGFTELITLLDLAQQQPNIAVFWTNSFWGYASAGDPNNNPNHSLSAFNAANAASLAVHDNYNGNYYGYDSAITFGADVTLTPVN